MLIRSSRTLLAAAVVALLTVPEIGPAQALTGDTSVALYPPTVDALVGLGFSFAPVPPATLEALEAVFPISGGNLSGGIIDHSGGLGLTKGGVTTDITDFEINLNTDILSGFVNGGASLTPFFNIGTGDVLTLNSTLAGALSSIYGIPNLTGATIGTATVTVTSVPEPSIWAMMLLGFGGLGCAGYRGSRKERRYRCLSADLSREAVFGRPFLFGLP